MWRGETITLTEENAHAWAEYYVSGVGFVPFEVTPGYIDDEELSLAATARMRIPMRTTPSNL